MRSEIVRVLMVPHFEQVRREENGIRRVIEAYFKHLPKHGIEFVAPKATSYDLKVAHAGSATDAQVAHNHGVYWTAEYESSAWEYEVNARVIESVRQASQITVPSQWVAEAFRRDMRLSPHVVPHGIDWQAWQGDTPRWRHILWAKNRSSDACDPRPVGELARRFPKLPFVATFGNEANNVRVIGSQPGADMKPLIQQALVYLATVKETFGIQTLEAMASGVPILGFRHGATPDLVQHGVNGYLAAPGDYDDLAEGLNYCIEHRVTLGENGREMARRWTWETACEQVAHVYDLALHHEPATAAIVIPTYNKAASIERTIRSAMAQDYPLLRLIVVVDDGTDDGGETERIVTGLMESDQRILYRKQANRGVAHARNAGIEIAGAKYVACLDGDDAIEPGFLSACIPSLEADPSLGIAYTSLRYIKPDGETGVSQWPGEWDYDAQLKRHNQIPTCCVFRREMWARLGGYRQRYAPKGAGAEDAEFWLRSGALGWRAAKVSEKPLFVYSWQSGIVSGDKNYREVDWLSWHPWAQDGLHPFASLAKPKRHSHPVRSYDRPIVSVVIPVGSGHETAIIDALDSLEAQTERQWEVIVAWDQETEAPETLRTAYPYIRWAHTAGKGAGAARNAGAALARAPFLLFLDADDWLYPEAMARMLEEWQREDAVIYTDYVGKAIIDNPDGLDPDLRRRMYTWDGREAVIGFRSADYEPDIAQRQPDPRRPVIWCNVTALVPRVWHETIGGFDEAMASWEDWDYHIRMAKAGYCYRRIPEELMVYRFYSGHRREFGRQEHKALLEYMLAKHQEIEIVGCRCKDKPKTGPNATTSIVASTVASANGAMAMSDSEYVLVLYAHPNRGQHVVVGGVTKTKYGYRAGGDTFLVHKDDIKSQPHLFQPIEARPVAPSATPQPVIAPVALPKLDRDSSPAQRPEPLPSWDDMRADLYAELYVEGDILDGSDDEELDLQLLPGVTPAIARAMQTAGLVTAEAILEAGAEGLQAIKGIGETRAEMILEHLAKQPALKVPVPSA
jgi:glycosyltransferase involved in cell wall biosynthesis